jgi:hypothetical protein
MSADGDDDDDGDDMHRTLALLMAAIALVQRQGNTIQRLLWLNYASLAMVGAAVLMVFVALWGLRR